MKRTVIVLGAVVFAGAALVVASIASASSSSAAAKLTKVTIVMHDPGCHWFQAGKKLTKTMSVKGPVALFNIDEAAMIVKGPQGTKLDGVGKTITLAKGVYHITMVKQASDDNHLLLRVS